MTEPSPGGWGPCPPGELGRLSAWLAFRRRLRAAAASAVLLLAAAGLAGGGWAAYSAFQGPPVAGDCGSSDGCGTDPEPAPCGGDPAAEKSAPVPEKK
jgi:hypothetical protein